MPKRDPGSPQHQFAAFFDGFESLSTQTDALTEFRRFLAQFQNIPNAPDLTQPAQNSEVDFARFLAGFEALWRPYIEQNADCPPSINIFKIANLGEDEVRNCRLLKWLLDPNESHFQGTRFLRCFFGVMDEPWIDEPQVPFVRREVGAGVDCRLDLLFEFRAVLACIEVKINSCEDTEQLTRYFETITTTLLGSRRFIGRLLSEGGDHGETVVEGFRRLLWSDVAKALMRFAGTDGDDDLFAAKSPFVRQLALQYADFITSYF